MVEKTQNVADAELKHKTAVIFGEIVTQLSALGLIVMAFMLAARFVAELLRRFGGVLSDLPLRDATGVILCVILLVVWSFHTRKMFRGQ